MTDLSHYVSGKRVDGTSGRFADVFNPATGAVEKRVPLATTAEVSEIVAVAKAGWPAWAKTPPLRRVRILDKFKFLLQENADQIAEPISEHGKTHDDALGGVTRGLEVAVGIPHLLALACGNCFVLKPSERDPSASLFIAELLTQAGVPDGGRAGRG